MCHSLLPHFVVAGAGSWPRRSGKERLWIGLKAGICAAWIGLGRVQARLARALAETLCSSLPASRMALIVAYFRARERSLTSGRLLAALDSGALF